MYLSQMRQKNTGISAFEIFQCENCKQYWYIHCSDNTIFEIIIDTNNKVCNTLGIGNLLAKISNGVRFITKLYVTFVTNHLVDLHGRNI
jgi:hypothetical protein